MCIVDQEKGNTALLFKVLHKCNLMLVDVLQGKGVDCAFFGVKANRYALHGADVIDGTLLFEISQRDLPAFLVHPDRRYGCRNLLNQGKSVVTVYLVTHINHFFQYRTSEST